MRRAHTAVRVLCVLSAACADPADELGERAAASTPVAWTDLVGVSATVGELSKSAAESTWNAGAVSVQALVGDGFAEFSSGENTTDKALGLSSGNGGQNLADIDFAIRLNASGRATVFEGGVNVAAMGPYAAGDVFRVQAEDGAVTYWKNGQLGYTSARTPGFPLVIDTALRTPGATLTGVRIEPIDFWTAAVGVAVDGRDITKTAPEDQYNAGAISLASIPSGDGYVEFRAASTTSLVAAGLSRGDSSQSRGDIDFAIQLNDRGGVGIYERGVAVGSAGPYRAGDVFRVQVAGGVVSYYRNRVLLHTSSAVPSYPLLLDASIRTPGASILGARLVAGYATGECSPSQQTLPGAPAVIAAEGEVMVAGDSAGSPPTAIVHRRTLQGWAAEQVLSRPVGPSPTAWATGVATDGETIAVVGGDVAEQPGYVQLYRHDGAAWVEDSRIDACPDGDDGGLTGVAVLGDLLAVREKSPRRIRVYRRVAGSWTLDALIVQPYNGLFASVALGGGRVFAGTWSGLTTPNGAVEIFEYDAGLPDAPPADACGPSGPGKWRETTVLAPAQFHLYSAVVAAPSGTRLLVDDVDLPNDVHVLQLDDGVWSEVARLAPTPYARTFGGSFDVAGTDGAPAAVVGGAATWIFAGLDDGWTQVSRLAGDSGAVAGTADTVFRVDGAAGVIHVHGLDPVCLAE